MSATDNSLWNCSFSQTNKERNKQLFNPTIEKFSISISTIAIQRSVYKKK